MWKFLLNFIPGVGPFLSAAGSFIAAHWKFFIIAAMVGCIWYQNTQSKRWLFTLGTIPYYEQTVIKQKDTIDKLNSALDTSTKANAVLAGTITALNADVSTWAEKSKELEQQNIALQANVTQVRTDTDAKIKAILNGPAPVTCEDSINYLRNQIPGLIWAQK